MTTQKKTRVKKSLSVKPHIDLYDKLKIKDKLTAIAGWVMNGDTDEQLAEKLGAGRKTLYNWKGKHPEFAEAVKVTKTLRLGEVIHSAFKQATGYDYYEDVVIKAGPDKQMVVRLLKHQPAVPMMTCFMLQNKLPDDFKDRRAIDVTSKGNELKPAQLNVLNLSGLSDEELETLDRIVSKTTPNLISNTGGESPTSSDTVHSVHPSAILESGAPVAISAEAGAGGSGQTQESHRDNAAPSPQV